ncbi:MAG: hypothetical protein HFI99_18630 [Lachnospiraceae bacterium]|nr:hypothetical protein [Lachnospiraceae bacterium]
MKIKRILALIAAGVMTISACMVVSAEESKESVSGNQVNAVVDSREAEMARAAEAFALEIAATGIPYEAWLGAENEGKTIGEYLSNSVMELPGLDEVTPVGQGGGVVLDGKVSNVSFSIQKPLLTYVNWAKAQADTIGGKVLNVVDPKSTAVFETATVNFYMPGVTAEQKIQVLQYVDKQWVNLNVAEVREDHVVVDMTSLGVTAFVEVQ